MKLFFSTILFLGVILNANAQSKLNSFQNFGFSYSGPCINNDYEDWGFDSTLGLFSANLLGDGDDYENDIADITLWSCYSENNQSKYIIKQKRQSELDNYFSGDVYYYNHKNGFRIEYQQSKYDKKLYNFVIYKEGTKYTRFVYGSINAKSFDSFINTLNRFTFYN